MFFKSLIPVAAAAFLAVQASVIPRTDLSPVPTSKLEARTQCNCAPGQGIGSSITSITKIDVGLKTFTSTHLGYAGAVTDVFASITSSIDVKTWLGIATSLHSWTSADLTLLVSELTDFCAGTAGASTVLIVKAGIDISSFTVVEAAHLKTFISTCVSVYTNIAVDVRADIDLFVYNSVYVAGCTTTSLKSKISIYISTLVNVVAALKLDVKVATCVSAAAALKVAVRAYINTCFNGLGLLAITVKASLTLLLTVCNSWVSGSLSLISSLTTLLLGITINLSTAADVDVCQSIIKSLLKISTKFDLVAHLGLDANLYTNIFTSVVAH